MSQEVISLKEATPTLSAEEYRMEMHGAGGNVHALQIEGIPWTTTKSHVFGDVWHTTEQAL